jgi:hypothetical protein
VKATGGDIRQAPRYDTDISLFVRPRTERMVRTAECGG